MDYTVIEYRRCHICLIHLFLSNLSKTCCQKNCLSCFSLSKLIRSRTWSLLSLSWISPFTNMFSNTEKQCTIKQMKDRKQYDAVNHLNHVNSLHSRIKAQYKRYRSVASKYINRYAALFRIQELYRKINGQEMITSLLMKLRHLHTTFFIRQIRNESIFNVTF